LIKKFEKKKKSLTLLIMQFTLLVLFMKNKNKNRSRLNNEKNVSNSMGTPEENAVEIRIVIKIEST
jgi:DNA-binding response OmpR family regulator